MRWLTRLLLAVCLSAAVLCTEQTPVEGKGTTAKLDHVERVTGGAKASEALPLVIAIHGLGDTPENFLELFRGFEQAARIVAPRAPDPWHGGSSWYPFRGTPAEKLPVIRARADLLASFIGELRKERPSVGRTIVTGFSQGGVMSFALAAYHPELLEAALPVAGMLDAGLPDPVPMSSPLTVNAFHGTRDDMVSYAGGAASVERLKKAGRAATLKTYEGIGHTITPDMEKDLLAALRQALDAARTRKAPR
jgi:phospholipase/carboxylesterase